ncbi:MAG: NFACT family protein, partial [Eubacteriales bacterium]|nr:NFACT family protein [Eubacteriales bacterium]
MAMDGIALGAVIYELQPLIGGKIDKVQQPEKDLLLFVVRANNANHRLLVSTHAENGRIQLTSRSFDNPMNAPAFCMLLRSRLIGGRICSIRQLGADRVCEIIMLARNELFDEVSLRLIVELTGKHANLLLLEPNGAIVDCLRRISANNDGARILLPGFPYEPIVSQDKQDPFTAPLEAFETAISSPDPVRAMTASFDGVSKQTANALLSAAPSPAALYALLQSMKTGSYAPCIAFNAEG